MKPKLNLLVAAFALLVSVTWAQSESVLDHPLTLASADAAASGQSDPLSRLDPLFQGKLFQFHPNRTGNIGDPRPVKGLA